MKSTMETRPAALEGMMPMSLWKSEPTTMRGTQCTSRSLFTSTTSYLLSCRNSGRNLATHQGLRSLSRNCTSPLNLRVLRKSGTSTSV